MKRGFTVLGLVWLAAAGACTVNVEVPFDAQLTCNDAGQCPEGWTCDFKEGICLNPQGSNAPVKDAGGRLPGDAGTGSGDAGLGDAGDAGLSWEDVPRAADKEEVCGLLYDKVTECEDVARDKLGPEVYALFESGKDAFVYETCIVDLMSDVTDEELDDYLSQKDLLPIAPCDMFIDELCQMFTTAAGYQTNCG